MPDAPRTHFVGCGRLGLTLGSLFADAGSIEVADIVTRSLESATAARAFIGAGRPLARLTDLGSADMILLLTPDADLAATARQLAATEVALEGVAVVHTSGALSSDVLAPLRAKGASIASLHPIRSFAAAEHDARALDGVVCGAEGDEGALALARPMFEQAGARIVAIEAEAKTLYHAAAVLACNHLVGLVESSLQAYAASGIDRDLALAALAPLVRGTVENVLEHGPEGALSGPIVRGEAAVVRKQLTALGRVSTELADVYRVLARQTLPLVRRLDGADPERTEAVADVLTDATRNRGD